MKNINTLQYKMMFFLGQYYLFFVVGYLLHFSYTPVNFHNVYPFSENQYLLYIYPSDVHIIGAAKGIFVFIIEPGV